MGSVGLNQELLYGVYLRFQEGLPSNNTDGKTSFKYIENSSGLTPDIKAEIDAIIRAIKITTYTSVLLNPVHEKDGVLLAPYLLITTETQQVVVCIEKDIIRPALNDKAAIIASMYTGQWIHIYVPIFNTFSTGHINLLITQPENEPV